MADERTSQPQNTDEAEVEGHSRRSFATPEADQDADAEGHAARGIRAAGLPVDLETEDEGFEDPGDDTEGHRFYK